MGQVRLVGLILLAMVAHAEVSAMPVSQGTMTLRRRHQILGESDLDRRDLSSLLGGPSSAQGDGAGAGVAGMGGMLAKAFAMRSLFGHGKDDGEKGHHHGKDRHGDQAGESSGMGSALKMLAEHPGMVNQAMSALQQNPGLMQGALAKVKSLASMYLNRAPGPAAGGSANPAGR